MLFGQHLAAFEVCHTWLNNRMIRNINALMSRRVMFNNRPIREGNGARTRCEQLVVQARCDPYDHDALWFVLPTPHFSKSTFVPGAVLTTQT